MSECHIYGCKKLKTICESCDRVVCTTNFTDNLWIKCSDRLPKDQDDYLTFVMDNGCSYRQEVQRFYKTPKVLKGMYGDSFSHWELTTWDDHICIAWMPLPNPPQE